MHKKINNLKAHKQKLLNDLLASFQVLCDKMLKGPLTTVEEFRYNNLARRIEALQQELKN
jgi:hypothetical protein